MPFPKGMKKKTWTKNKKTWKKGVRKAKSEGLMPFRVSNTQIYNRNVSPTTKFVRTYFSQGSITGADASYGTNYAIQADAMPDWSVISALYNRFRLDKVTYTFTLIDPSVSTPNLVTARLPELLMRYNYDSGAPTPTGTTMGALGNVVSTKLTLDQNRVSYTWIPKTVSPLYLGLTTSGYKLNAPLFIDVAYGGVPHYGMSLVVDFLAAGLTILIDVEYHVTMRYEK